MLAGDSYFSWHLVLSLSGLAFVLLFETSDILYRLDIIPDFDIITGLNIIILHLTFHQILVFIEHLQLVLHADRGRLFLRTPGPVPFGLAYVLLVETNPFYELVIFPDYALRISLGTFSILLYMIVNIIPQRELGYNIISDATSTYFVELIVHSRFILRVYSPRQS